MLLFKIYMHAFMAFVVAIILIYIVLNAHKLKRIFPQKPVEENESDKKERARKIVMRASNHDNH